MDNREKLPRIDNKMAKPPLPPQNGAPNNSGVCVCGHMDEKE